MAFPQVEPTEFNDLVQELRELRKTAVVDRFTADKTAWADGYQYGYVDALVHVLAEMAGFDPNNERHVAMLRGAIEVNP